MTVIEHMFWRFLVPWRPIVAPMGRRLLIFSYIRNVLVLNFYYSS